MNFRNLFQLILTLILPIGFPLYMLSLDKIDRVIDSDTAIALVCLQMAMIFFSMAIEYSFKTKKSRYFNSSEFQRLKTQFIN